MLWLDDDASLISLLLLGSVLFCTLAALSYKRFYSKADLTLHMLLSVEGYVFLSLADNCLSSFHLRVITLPRAFGHALSTQIPA